MSRGRAGLCLYNMLSEYCDKVTMPSLVELLVGLYYDRPIREHIISGSIAELRTIEANECIIEIMRFRQRYMS